MVDNVNADRQAELDALGAERDAAVAKVMVLEAEKLALAQKSRPFKMADVDKWDGKSALGPFIDNNDAFLEDVDKDSERLRYLIRRCSGHPQEHLRSQRDLHSKAGKVFTYEHAKEALRSLFFTVDPKTESHRLVVVEGITQGRRTVKAYVQDITSHMSRLSSTDEDTRSYLLQGLSDETFRQTAMATFVGRGEVVTVTDLSKHLLELAQLCDRPAKDAGAGRVVSGQGKAKGAALGAQGGVQKPGALGKPAHAKTLSFQQRQQLKRDRKCFACGEVGHTQHDADKCSKHPKHAAVGTGLAAMQVDPKN